MNDIVLVHDPGSAFPLEQALAERYAVHAISRGDAVPDAARKAVALVTTTNAGVSDVLLKALPALRVIAVAGGHLHNVDLPAAQRRGLRVLHTPGVSTHDVADMTMALLLACVRGVCAGDRFVRDGRWGREVPPLRHSLAGSRLGIFGLGRIGTAVAQRAEAFGIEVAYCGPHPKDVPYGYFADLLEMAGSVDWLVVTCASVPATRMVVDADVIAALGPDGCLVSVVAGAVDEAALASTLQRGELAAAALDVFSGEPMVDPALLDSPRLVLSPHASSKTIESKRRTVELLVATLSEALSDSPISQAGNGVRR